MAQPLCCILLSWLAVTYALAASSPPTWTTNPLIQTGIGCVDHLGAVTLLSGTTTTGTVPTTFVTPYPATPKFAYGMHVLKLNGDGEKSLILNFDMKVGSLTSTGFNITYTIGGSYTITMLYITYMAIDSTDATIFTLYDAPFEMVVNMTPISSGSGYRSLTANNFNFVGPPVNITHTNKLLFLMSSLVLTRGGGLVLNFTVAGSGFVNASRYYITLATSHNCSITKYHASRITLDKTALESTYTTFMDTDRTFATLSSWTALTFTLPWKSPNNFVIGLQSFSIVLQTNNAKLAFSFTFNISTLSTTGTGSFAMLEFVYFSYRQRTCPAGFPYYLTTDGLCYDICPGGTLPNITINACQTCSYTCLTCSSPNTVCLTCDAAMFRVLSGTACICQTGYYDVGVAMCAACSYTCLSCNSSTNCTSCSGTNFRTLSTGQCPCNSGYVDTGVGLCGSCSALIGGCTACSSPTVCTTCGGGYMLSAGSCVCSVGTYSSGSTCTLCSTTMLGCTSCTSSTVCTACSTSLFFQLSGSSCACSFGYYLAGTTCVSCSSMVGCVSCTNSTNCVACNATLNLVVDPVSFNCTCAVGYYMSGTACLACSSAIPMCSQCSSNTICTACTLPAVIVGTTCGCGAGTYNDGLGNCIACSTTLPGCTICSSATVCTACNSTLFYTLNTTTNTCDCSSGYISNGGMCVVKCLLTTQYFNGTLCMPCFSTCATCLGGSPVNCTSCFAPNTLQGSQCQCPAGQYMDATYICQPCSLMCLTCINSSTTCLSCPSPMLLSGTACTCSGGSYLPAGTPTCSPCDISCAVCTGSSNNQCSLCSPTYILTGTTCACAPLQYSDPVTGDCTPCHYSCLTCSDSTSAGCLTCDPTRTLSGTTCPCNPGQFDIGLAACYSSNCQVGYAPDASGVCQEICGDGRVYTLPCDDGNNVNGDGCSSSCSIEANYTCQSGTTTSPSVCSYNQPITLTLLSTTKNLTDNIVYFDIQISPALSSLAGLNFTSVLSSNLTGANLTYTYNSLTGRLMVAAQYTASIQSQNVSLIFTPASSASSPYFFATPPTAFSFVVTPENNLAAESLDSDTYARVKGFEALWQVLMYMSLAGFLLSMFLARFIGVEMVGVIQVAFLGLMMIDHLQPLLAPLAKIYPINGLNTVFSGQPQNKTLPYRASSLQYGASMAYSFNLSLILLLLPPFISLIVFIASKIRKDVEDKLRKISMDILCDYGLTAVAFLAYHLTASLCLFVAFDSPETSTLYGGSVAESFVVMIVVAAVLVLFRYFPKNFGQYRIAFNNDPMSQYHYYFLVACRVILAIIIAMANDSARVGYVALIPSVLALIYLCSKRPYRHLYNNIRAICNEAVIFITLSIYAYYRSGVPYGEHMRTTSTALPYVLAVLLFSCVIGNITIMIRWKCDRLKEQKTGEKIDVAKMQDDENALFMDESKKKMSGLSKDRTSSPMRSGRLQSNVASNKPESKQAGYEHPQKPAIEMEELYASKIAEQASVKKRPDIKEKLLRSKLVYSPKIYEMHIAEGIAAKYGEI